MRGWYPPDALRMQVPVDGAAQHLSRYSAPWGVAMEATSRGEGKVIVALRRRHWTYKRIAKHVGMAPSDVHKALNRIAEGRPGRDPRAI